MNDLTPIIGSNLAQLRRQKGLTLDKLADLSGVSKAMIGQIERGESNPTVNTLWKIAAGLHVAFGKLIDARKPMAELVRLSELSPIKDDEDGMSLFLLFSFDQDKRFEIFSVSLAPQCTHLSDPHEAGSDEYTLLTEGTLEITVGPEIHRLTQGDAIRFQADKPHTYRNPTDNIARFQSILYYNCS